MKKYTLSVLFAVAAFTGKYALAYEEPIFESVHKTDIYEIRLYQERLVAEVIENERNSAFKALFAYISGDNEKSIEMSMTIPVTESLSEESSTMHFFLPKNYSQSTAPMPSNERVSIKMLPAEYLAVITYSGFASDDNFEKHGKELKAALKKDNIEILDEAIKATYNGPFTLPFFRRNEAMIKVNWQ